MPDYYLLYKPYKVLSRVGTVQGKISLQDIIKLQKHVYPVGRLDEDSEGLLLLTDDKKINHLLLHPSFSHEREYHVQVEGIITQQALNVLSAGFEINIKGSPHRTLPADVSLLENIAYVLDRVPPVRTRRHIPTSWIRMILTEGKNRQVRKMTAHVGFPTLRLIRYRIGDIELGNLQPGEFKKISRNSFYKKLFGHQES
jgi:23S rRNA pseudouridine2457 synthase